VPFIPAPPPGACMLRRVTRQGGGSTFRGGISQAAASASRTATRLEGHGHRHPFQ
jgi:hypothetical protein